MGLLTEYLFRKGKISQKTQFLIIFFLDIILFAVVIWGIYHNQINASACTSWCYLKACPIPKANITADVDIPKLTDDELKCWRYISIKQIGYNSPEKEIFSTPERSSINVSVEVR